MDKIRVVIAEDERTTREALSRLLDLEDDIAMIHIMVRRLAK